MSDDVCMQFKYDIYLSNSTCSKEGTLTKHPVVDHLLLSISSDTNLFRQSLNVDSYAHTHTHATSSHTEQHSCYAIRLLVHVLHTLHRDSDTVWQC